MPSVRTIAVAVVLVALGVPTAFFGALWAGQGAMIFPGPLVDEASVRARAHGAGADLVEVHTADGETLLGWHEGRGGDRAVLYFHGNGSICDRPDAHRALLDAGGWDYFCVAYRGYPGSTGTPSEEGLREDARAAWRYLTETVGVPPDRVVIHGRSLGGGVAAGLATEVDAGGLVLESTFRSVRAIAAAQYPAVAVDLLLAHRFETDARVGQIGEPTLVLHGDADEVIPVDHGRWLGAHIASAHYVEAPGHHHNSGLLTDDPGCRAAFAAFLASHAD